MPCCSTWKARSSSSSRSTRSVTRGSRSGRRWTESCGPDGAATVSPSYPRCSVAQVVTPDSRVTLVAARGLVKRFGDFTAVDGIDFEIYRGESFGFLGPNGAGKTSTMKMVSCISPPTEGTLTVLGQDPKTKGPQIRARLGLVPQEDSLELELSAMDNLIMYGRYFDLPRAEIKRRATELLEFTQLSERANDKADNFS